MRILTGEHALELAWIILHITSQGSRQSSPVQSSYDLGYRLLSEHGNWQHRTRSQFLNPIKYPPSRTIGFHHSLDRLNPQSHSTPIPKASLPSGRPSTLATLTSGNAPQTIWSHAPAWQNAAPRAAATWTRTRWNEPSCVAVIVAWCGGVAMLSSTRGQASLFVARETYTS